MSSTTKRIGRWRISKAIDLVLAGWTVHDACVEAGFSGRMLSTYVTFLDRSPWRSRQRAPRLTMAQRREQWRQLGADARGGLR